MMEKTDSGLEKDILNGIKRLLSYIKTHLCMNGTSETLRKW